MKILLAILTLAFISMGCDPNKFTSDSSDPHATKIIVKLIGKYATEETVDVTIGSGGATTLGKGALAAEAYANVDPGSYSVTGVAHGCQTGSWSTTATVEAGQQKTINFNVDDATLTVKPDVLWIGKHNRFRVTLYLEDGHPSFVVNAGGSESYPFRPGKTGNMVHVADEDTGEALFTTEIKIFYGGTFTLTIPYK
ncbi:MAG TPA: hypothetical protein VIX80_06615 [Candidatus Kapabacteria bacterium]